MGGTQAKELYQLFFSKVQQGYSPEKVKDGVFQAMMVSSLTLRSLSVHSQLLQEVALVNDGPVSGCLVLKAVSPVVDLV